MGGGGNCVCVCVSMCKVGLDLSDYMEGKLNARRLNV